MLHRLVCSILLVFCLVQAEDDYVFDESVDIDSVIKNDAILNSYLKCFFNTGACSSRAERVKGKISHVFSTVCGDCSPRQKQLLHHVLTIFVTRRPDDWKKLLEMYDPENKYTAQMNAFISAPEPQV
ncbi:ejaculatory bulb-specific protein 3-like [Cimex lectularius]|uniref:Chemosensory protein n=1 Tax=Cimex lectularius TaxID=79782 RepID=A0A8I6RHV3_CIMLE|nr:ejaculatory bulb-specific protein 3-like [Cimex lectularius]